MQEPFPQILVLSGLFIFWFLMYWRNNSLEETIEPELPEHETEGSFVWYHKKGGSNLYKMIQLTHKELKEGLRAEIENGEVSMYTSVSGVLLPSFYHKAPRFNNFEGLRKAMKRYLEERLPKNEVEFKPVKSIKDHKIEYKALMTGAEMEKVVGGKQNRLQQLFGLFRKPLPY